MDKLCDIMAYTENKKEFFRTRFGIEKIPSKPTISRTLAVIDGQKVDESILAMMQDAISLKGDVIAVDGKAIRSTSQKGKPHSALQIITDSIFRLGDQTYHMECQSTPDGTMAIRMFEYDLAIAMEKARRDGRPYCVKFPFSVVLFLRLSHALPEKLTVEVLFPNGKSIPYEVPVLQIQRYTIDELFQKNLLLFLPYYIMRYEKDFPEMERDKKKRACMVDELQRIATTLTTYIEEEKNPNICADILRLMQSTSDYILRNHPKTKKEVRFTMGGKILELYSEKMIRKRKKERRKEGREEGREEVAMDMLRDHMPIEKIAKYSKLTVDRITELAGLHGLV